MTETDAGRLELEQAADLRTELRHFLHRTSVAAGHARLTPQRYDLLLMIKTGRQPDGSSTVTELGQRLQLKQTAVTELVARAVEAGLVRREQSPLDGRVWLLTLTREGDQRVMQAFFELREDRAFFARAFRRVGTRFRASMPRPKGHSYG